MFDNGEEEDPEEDPEEVDELSSTEELDLPTPIKEEMECGDSAAASPGNSPKPKNAKRSKSSSSLKADGPKDMRSSYWTYIHDQQKQIKKENPEMKPKDVLKMAREKSLNSNNQSVNISDQHSDGPRVQNNQDIEASSELHLLVNPNYIEVDVLHVKTLTSTINYWFQVTYYSQWPSTLSNPAAGFNTLLTSPQVADMRDPNEQREPFVQEWAQPSPNQKVSCVTNV